MKKIIGTLFLLTVFQGVCSYLIADISFILADEELLKEIGVIASAEESVEEEAAKKEAAKNAIIEIEKINVVPVEVH